MIEKRLIEEHEVSCLVLLYFLLFSKHQLGVIHLLGSDGKRSFAQFHSQFITNGLRIVLSLDAVEGFEHALDLIEFD